MIYELHVKGFTARHPDISPKLRGTYAGLARPAAIQHLKTLGVTAVELMPVHQFIHDRPPRARDCATIWGYNSIGFFAPHNAYSSSGNRGEQVQEFKAMVKALHAAGIEVILDVVYNHTAEGNQLGPTLSFKGIDNAAYYRLVDGDPRHYMDYTGTGNSLNMRHPHVLQLIMDTLRYWVTEMHVDGFRFDLAATLARELHDVDRLSRLLRSHPAGPDRQPGQAHRRALGLGEGGYQVGNFPPLWSEWNGRYRDTVRRLLAGRAGHARRVRLPPDRELAISTTATAATPTPASISSPPTTASPWPTWSPTTTSTTRPTARTTATATDDNRSWNCGAEGPTRRRRRSSSCGGASSATSWPPCSCPRACRCCWPATRCGRTQQGNNNAYCQDNEISYLDWDQR